MHVAKISSKKKSFLIRHSTLDYVPSRPVCQNIIGHKILAIKSCSYMGRSRGGTGSLDPSRKSKVAIGFNRNTGTDPTREAIGPFVK